MISTRFATTAGGLLATLAGLSASADIECSYYRTNMPDFDQIRRADFPIFGLPNNGNAYCVPTSSSNLLAYLQQMGYTNFFGNVGPSWYGAGAYANVTIQLQFLGGLMNTSPTEGTNEGWEPGMVQNLEIKYPGMFTCYTVNPGNSFPWYVQNYFGAGYLMTFCYGRYALTPFDGVFNTRYVRSGGHCVTINGIVGGCGVFPTITYRDPASANADDTTQSPFSTTQQDINATSQLFAYAVDQQPKVRTMWQFSQNFADGKLRVIDGVMVLGPVGGVFGGVQSGVFKRKPLLDLNKGIVNPPNTTHALPAAMGGLSGLKLHPHLPAAVCVGGDGGLWLVNRVEGSSRRLADAGTGPMCFGPDGRLFVARAGAVEVINPLDAAAPTESVATREHVLLAIGTTDVGVDGDPLDYQLIAVSRDSRGGIFIASGDVNGDGCAPFEPQPLPISGLSGGCQIAVSPVDGSVLVLADGSRSLVRCAPSAAGGWVVTETIALPVPSGSTHDPKNLQLDLSGRPMYTHGGVVEVLEQNLASGLWEPKTDSPWNGLVAGDFFELERGRNDILPWRGSPSDRNFDPSTEPQGTQVPDCVADFNKDGFVDGFDYDDFVTCFEGEGSCLSINPQALAADIDGDGFVDGFDYDEFVRAFEAGC